MMHNMTKLIAENLEQAGYEYEMEDFLNRSAVQVPMRGVNGHLYSIQFISTNEMNDVFVRVFALMKDLTAVQKHRLLPVINDINCRDDHGFCFYIDKDDELALRYDFVRSFPDPENHVVAMVEDIHVLLDEVCPLMLAIADDADE